MIVKGQILIKNRNPFCLYKNQEVGIADGYIAGDIFADNDDDSYLTCTGDQFGWFNYAGDYTCDSKYAFTRPTNEQIVAACIEHPNLADIAQAKGLVEMTREEHNSPMADCITQICLN